MTDLNIALLMLVALAGLLAVLVSPIAGLIYLFPGGMAVHRALN